MGNKSPKEGRISKPLIKVPEIAEKAFEEEIVFTILNGDKTEERTKLNGILANPAVLANKTLIVPQQSNDRDLIEIIKAVEQIGIALQMKVGEICSRVLKKEFFKKVFFHSDLSFIHFVGAHFTLIKRSKVRFLSFDSSFAEEEQISYVLSELGKALAENLSANAKLTLYNFPNFLINYKKQFLIEIQLSDVPLSCIPAFTAQLPPIMFKQIRANNRDLGTNYYIKGNFEKVKFLKQTLFRRSRSLLLELETYSHSYSPTEKFCVEEEFILLENLLKAESFMRVCFKISIHEPNCDFLSHVMQGLAKLKCNNRHLIINLLCLSTKMITILEKSGNLPDELSIFIDDNQYFKNSSLNQNLIALRLLFPVFPIDISNLSIFLKGINKLKSFEIEIQSSASDQKSLTSFITELLTSNKGLKELKLVMILEGNAKPVLMNIFATVSQEGKNLLSFFLSITGILIDEELKRPYVNMIQSLKNLRKIFIYFSDNLKSSEEKELSELIVVLPIIKLKSAKSIGLNIKSKNPLILLLLHKLKAFNKFYQNLSLPESKHHFEYKPAFEKKKRLHNVIFQVLWLWRENNSIKKLSIRKEIKDKIAILAMGL